MLRTLSSKPTPAMNKFGWGVINIPDEPGTYLIKRLSFQPGLWTVWAPVRIQYGITPSGCDVCFGTPSVLPVSFEASTQQPNGGGKTYMDDELCMVGFNMECDKETVVPLQIIVNGNGGINEVLDGDALVIGWLK